MRYDTLLYALIFGAFEDCRGVNHECSFKLELVTALFASSQLELEWSGDQRQGNARPAIANYRRARIQWITPLLSEASSVSASWG